MQAPAGLQPTMWNYANLVDFVKQCETISTYSIMEAPAGLQPTMWNYANLVDFVKQCETISSFEFQYQTFNIMQAPASWPSAGDVKLSQLGRFS